MKKTVLIFVAILAFTAAASAQPRAIGARLSAGFEASYQHTVGANDNFVELDLGYVVGCKSQKDWFNVSAVYDFMIAQPDWTSRGEWGFYAGPGIALGASGHQFAVGLAGQVGLEYTFWFPLQLAFDIRPEFGYARYYKRDTFDCWAWYPTISVRYRF